MNEPFSLALSTQRVAYETLGHSAATALTYYQKTSQSQKVGDAVKQAYSDVHELPSLMN